MNLQKAARGFLELFYLQSLGRNPSQVGEIIQPTIDVTPFYAADRMLTGSNTVFGGAANGTVPLIATGAVAVPGTMLFALGGALTVGAAPGTRWRVTWGYRMQAANNQFCAIGSENLGTLIAAQQVEFGLALPFPLVTNMGSVLEVQAASDAAGADHQLRIKFAMYFPPT